MAFKDILTYRRSSKKYHNWYVTRAVYNYQISNIMALLKLWILNAISWCSSHVIFTGKESCL